MSPYTSEKSAESSNTVNQIITIFSVSSKINFKTHVYENSCTSVPVTYMVDLGTGFKVNLYTMISVLL